MPAQFYWTLLWLTVTAAVAILVLALRPSPDEVSDDMQVRLGAPTVVLVALAAVALISCAFPYSLPQALLDLLRLAAGSLGI